MALIYIVEDDQNIREIESFALKNSGYTIMDFECAKDFYHQLAEKYMPNGVCGVLCFGPKGGKEGAMRFTNALKLIAIVTHVADARTCVLHPASHTHRQLSDEQLREAGVDPSLIRLSVGIENVDDIIEDIRQALED